MRRRELLALLAGTAVGWPLTAGAQRKAMRMIGFLSGVSAETYTPFVAAFHSGLNELGYVEGSNLAVEYRWAEDHPDRLPALAEDLVSRKVEVIVAGGGAPGTAKAATATIPIVFVIGTDPVAARIVTSLNRPGGNRVKRPASISSRRSLACRIDRLRAIVITLPAIGRRFGV